MLHLLPVPMVVTWLRFSVAFVCVFVCLFVFPCDISKLMQLRSPNLTHKCSMISPGKPFILGLKGQRSRSRGTINIAGAGHGALVSTGF